jgi:hypothetical protein
MDFIGDTIEGRERNGEKDEKKRLEAKVMPQGGGHQKTQKSVFGEMGGFIVRDMKGGSGREVENEAAIGEDEEPVNDAVFIGEHMVLVGAIPMWSPSIENSIASKLRAAT